MYEKFHVTDKSISTNKQRVILHTSKNVKISFNKVYIGFTWSSRPKRAIVLALIVVFAEDFIFSTKHYYIFANYHPVVWGHTAMTPLI